MNVNVKMDRADANWNMIQVVTEVVLQVRMGDSKAGESDGDILSSG